MDDPWLSLNYNSFQSKASVDHPYKLYKYTRIEERQKREIKFLIEENRSLKQDV